MFMSLGSLTKTLVGQLKALGDKLENFKDKVVYGTTMMCVIVLVPFVIHMGIFVVSIFFGGSYTEAIRNAWIVAIILLVCVYCVICQAAGP